MATIKHTVTPIQGLNPYNNQFTIKAKLLHKARVMHDQQPTHI